MDRHAARVVFLTYEPPQAPKKNLFLVGKGVTYDTGGSDIKSGGIMAGMHRDKCGAAAVAGYFETLDKVKPQNLRVFGALAMVRNSIGTDPIEIACKSKGSLLNCPFITRTRWLCGR